MHESEKDGIILRLAECREEMWMSLGIENKDPGTLPEDDTDRLRKFLAILDFIYAGKHQNPDIYKTATRQPKMDRTW